MSTFEVLIVALLIGIIVIGVYWLAQQILTVVKDRTLLQHLKSRSQLRAQQFKKMLPYKATAYERMIIFLERINPYRLMRDVPSADITPALLRARWVHQIRQEMEYNASQQLYISPEAWQLIENAVEQVVLLINQSYRALDKDAGIHAFMGKIREQIHDWEILPHEAAIDALKNEFRQFAES